MKEFVCTVKQTFLVSRSEVLIYGLIAAGGGIVGMMIMLVILACGGMDGEYFEAGAAGAMILSVIMLLFSGIFSLKNDFDIAISMGKTRKYFVPAKYLMFVADCLTCGVIPIVISRVEAAVYKVFYPEIICGWELDVLFRNPFYWSGILLVAPVAIVLLGGLYLKFSTKFFWFFWAVWMLVWLGAPRLFSASEEKPDSLPGRMGAGVLQFFRQITQTQAAAAMLVFLIVSVIIIVLVFRKQRVTA